MKVQLTPVKGLFIAAVTTAMLLPIAQAKGPGTTKTPSSDIAHTPLFISTNAKPNIILGLDDSGSMDSEVLFFTNDGALWFDTTNDTYEGTDDSQGNATDGVINFNTSNQTSDLWKKYTYLFPNGASTTRPDDRLYQDLDDYHFAIAPFIQFAYTRSSDYNGFYYDPATQYLPWKDTESGGTFNFIDANPVAAKSDPAIGNLTFNLTANVITNAANSTFRLWDGVTIPAGTSYHDGASWKTMAIDTVVSNALVNHQVTPAPPAASVQGYVDYGYAYYPATYYKLVFGGTYSINGGATSNNCPASKTGGNATHYNTFKAAPSSFQGTGGTDAISGAAIKGVHALSPDGYCMEKVEIKSTTATYVHTRGADGKYNRKCADPTSCTYTEEMQNFANWFQYYRKRHMALRAALATSFTGQGGMYLDFIKINSNTKNVTMQDFDTLANRSNFLNTMFLINGNDGGTYNRETLHQIGKEFKRTNTGKPIIAECQKNYALFFTDGFSNTSTSSGVGDTDSNDGPPYADPAVGYSNTFADIARYYYENNLRTDLPAGKVPVQPECSLAAPSPELDCNVDPHMQTFVLTLNVKGKVFEQSTATSPLGTGMCNNSFTGTLKTVSDAHKCSPVWQNPNGPRDLAQVDDLYHAAVNGHGDMFNAASASDLSTQLSAALSAITADAGIAAGAIAVNGSSIQSGNTTVYVANYDTQGWHGDVTAYNIIKVGNKLQLDFANPVWKAAQVIPAPSARNIMTYDGKLSGGKGVAFNTDTGLAGGLISHLSTAMQNDLKTGLSSTDCSGGATIPVNCTAQERLLYLRGDAGSANVYESNTTFRTRTRSGNSPLGDIVNSSVIFVGKPASNWPSKAPFPTATGETFRDFRDKPSSINRKPVIYTSGNDGMFHGFDAATGAELLAFVPDSIVSSNNKEGLHWLSDPAYTHLSYVDLSPSFQDAYVYGRDSSGNQTGVRSWRTVMVGGLRGGGKGLYALDLTDPTSFSVTNASSLVLWEFNDRNAMYPTSTPDKDLGLTYALPTIAMTNVNDSGGVHKRWAAIFGNGYNSPNCSAVLYVAFMDGGIDGQWDGKDASTANYASADYVRIDTGNTQTSPGCNGLSEPALADLDGNGTVDRVYAGDMYGNMWAFDLCNRGATNCDTTTGWGVAYKVSSTPQPLFIAKDNGGIQQPITSRPALSLHPSINLTPTNDPNVLVAFGTGKYIENQDKTASYTVAGVSDIHTFYTVWDKGNSNYNLDRSKLQAKTQSLSTSSATGAIYRRTNTSVIQWDGIGTGTEFGWRLDLDPANATFAEERVIFGAAIRSNVVFYSTAIPSSALCTKGGDGWIMFMDLATGNPTDKPVIDTNNDGVVDGYDVADFAGGANLTVSGMKLPGAPGIPSAPQIHDDKLVNCKIGSNECYFTDLPPLAAKFEKRLNWRELRQQ